MRYDYLIPTSSPDLFVTRERRLLHKVVGLLKYDAFPPGRFVTLPDGSMLRVYWGAPPVALEIERFDHAKLIAADSTDVAAVIGTITGYVSGVADYISVAQFAIQVLNFLIDAIDDTKAKLDSIDRNLQALMSQIGALDYLSLLRRMADMRGNATAIVQTLDAVRTLLPGSSPDTWYQKELRSQDAQLHADINTLLDPSGAYFRRAYSEQAIVGDGVWMQIIPDRPGQSDGTTYEYRMALPTVGLLIAVRLAMMKFTVPDFVSRHTFSAEIQNWMQSLKGIAGTMNSYVRATNPMPIEVQCARRQQNGAQHIGDFRNWNQHCTIGAPYSVSPMGAVDITTGIGSINWEFTQFDEWYLGQGDLHGGDAGYWPPSVGPQYYQPPPQATGLPPYNRAISDYYEMSKGEVFGPSARVALVQQKIGAWAVTDFTYLLFDLLYPGVSDMRLKRDIVCVARLDNGLGLYRFRYRWSDQVYVGVMAQEVATVMPDAVMRGPGGCLRVDYGRLGVQRMTWNEWLASIARGEKKDVIAA